MKKNTLVVGSVLLMVLAACGSQVVEFPVDNGDGVKQDAGKPLPDASNPDAPTSDANKPDVNNNPPDASKPDAGNPDSGNTDDDDDTTTGDDDDDDDNDNHCTKCVCNASCQCKNKCNDALEVCKTNCEQTCNVWTKRACIDQCECDHDSCVSCCN